MKRIAQQSIKEFFNKTKELFESEVIIKRFGEITLPVDITIMFDDGKKEEKNNNHC